MVGVMADARGPGGPLYGIVNTIISPICQTVSDSLSAPIGGALGYWIGEVAKPGLADLFSLELQRSLPIQTVTQFMPALIQILPDQLAQTLSRALADYMTPHVTERMSTALAQHVPGHLDRSLPMRMSLEMPKMIAQNVGLTLGVILTKSLTHSVVPALLHCLSHQPLTDYYCWYCFKHETYCEYCQYSPLQIYFGSYYAGYFSSYYGRKSARQGRSDA
jgi:hypothetical protein